MSYRLYLDEIGDPGYPRFNYSEPGFCLVGCLIEDASHKIMDRTIQDLMRRSDLKTDVWIHRYHVQARRGEFSRLKTENRVGQFCRQAAKLIEDSPVILFAVSIDKRQMKTTYPNEYIDPFLKPDPLYLTITFMVERVATCAIQAGHAIREIVWEWGGPKENRRKQEIFDRCLTGGTQFCSAVELQQGLGRATHKFVRKRLDSPVAGLEVADWVARVFNAKGLGKPDYEEEFEIYRGKIWIGNTPGSPGQTGFKTFPKDIHRAVLGQPIDIYLK